MVPISSALQSVMRPAGTAAGDIATMWWVMLVAGSLVGLAVIGVALYAMLRRRRDDAGDLEERDRVATRWIVGAGALFPAVVLAFLFVFALVTLAALHPERGPREPQIEVTGRQWWWQVRYFGEQANQVIESANEVRIPAGRRVALTLRSGDVIHSFWIPALHGKLDMIPGKTTRLWIQADTPGVYRGHCAEFCGLQHARMRLTVVAMEPQAFAGWLANERGPAREPTEHEQREGRDLFLSAGCAVCHTIRGTPARGVLGPDLTHLGSRHTLAAGTLTNTRGNLAGWIANPQELKPGALMPRVPVGAHDLHALVHYLESLR